MFDVDATTKEMKIRKGTSGQLVFQDIPTDFNGYTARLIIKKEDASDANALVDIPVVISSNTALFQITSSESDLLTVNCGDSIGYYKWGVMIDNGAGYATNLIPEGFNSIPDCLVYPEIGGSN